MEDTRKPMTGAQRQALFRDRRRRLVKEAQRVCDLLRSYVDAGADARIAYDDLRGVEGEELLLQRVADSLAAGSLSLGRY